MDVGDHRPAPLISGGGRGGPVLVRMLLGAHLRRLREANDVTLGQAGWVVGCDVDEMARLERGRGPLGAERAKELLTRYDVLDRAERDAVLRLVAEADEPGWWQRFGDVLPGWMELYVGLEQAATSIRNYEVQFVPGLLQTDAYARAVIECARFPETETDDRVRLRMERQKILDHPDGPNYWVVVEEATLRRRVGGGHVMRDQLEHLLVKMKQPNVTMQVVPFELGDVAAVGGPFTLLRFAEPELPDVVYLEDLTSALYLEAEAEVETYRSLVDRLAAVALTPRRSAELVAGLAATY